MNPRLKESKKWTRFPPEFEKQIHITLQRAFPLQSQKGKFFVEGRIYKTEILVRLGYLEKGSIGPTNAESSIEYNSQKENVKKIIDLAIDTAASLLDNFFSQPDGDFPFQWMGFDMESKKVFLQISRVNPELEAQADQLLGISQQSPLVEGEDFDEEYQAMKEVFNSDED